MTSTPQNATPGCRLCGGRTRYVSARCLNYGQSAIAGVLVTPPRGMRLACCEDCGLLFKHPFCDAKLLHDAYVKGSHQVWSAESPADWRRKRYDLFREVILRHATGRRILDIGCYAGGFLQSLGEGWDKHGVEPNAAAAGGARRKGIAVCADASDLDREPADSYDVVTAFHVLEHLRDVDGFMRSTRRVLKPDGILVLATGNSAYPWFRLLRERYWYGAVFDHCTMFSKKTMGVLCVKYGLCERETVRFRPNRTGLRGTLIAHGRLCKYIVGLARGGRRPMGVHMTLKDHLLIVLAKRKADPAPARRVTVRKA